MSNLINIYGGPGTGKTTLAAVLFARLKQQGLFVDMCMEYAKELVYTQRLRATSEMSIAEEQLRRHAVMLRGGVTYVVTDAPLLQKVVYTELFGNYPQDAEVVQYEALRMESRYDTRLHIVLPEPAADLDMRGRAHGYLDSLKIHNHTRVKLQSLEIPYYPVGGINEAIEVVDNWIARGGR